jgi:UDP-N-acetylmuramyl pentapeptide synthase
VTLQINKQELFTLLNFQISSNAFVKESVDASDFLEGATHLVDSIRGGEIFFSMSRENSLQEAVEAFAQGAAICVIQRNSISQEGDYKSGEFKKCCIEVFDVQEAYVCLTQWWICKVNIPLTIVTGCEHSGTTKEILAALLASVGPGNYTPFNNRCFLTILSTLCSINYSHKWSVVEIPIELIKTVLQNLPVFNKYFLLITDLSLDLTSEIEVIQRFLNTPEKITVITQQSENNFIPKIKSGLFFRVEQEPFLKPFELQSCLEVYKVAVTLSSVVSHGTDGISGIISAKSTDQEFVLPLPGLHNSYAVAAAVAAAQAIFPVIELLQIAKRLQRFQPLLVGMQTVTTDSSVTVLHYSNPISIRGLIGMLEVAREMEQAGERVVVLLEELWNTGSLKFLDATVVFDQKTDKLLQKLMLPSNNLLIMNYKDAPQFLDELGKFEPSLVVVGGFNKVKSITLLEALTVYFGGEKLQARN